MKFDSFVGLVTNSSTSIFSFAEGEANLRRLINDVLELTKNGQYTPEIWIELDFGYLDTLADHELFSQEIL